MNSKKSNQSTNWWMWAFFAVVLLGGGYALIPKMQQQAQVFEVNTPAENMDLVIDQFSGTKVGNKWSVRKSGTNVGVGIYLDNLLEIKINAGAGDGDTASGSAILKEEIAEQEGIVFTTALNKPRSGGDKQRVMEAGSAFVSNDDAEDVRFVWKREADGKHYLEYRVTGNDGTILGSKKIVFEIDKVTLKVARRKKAGGETAYTFNYGVGRTDVDWTELGSVKSSTKLGGNGHVELYAKASKVESKYPLVGVYFDSFVLAKKK